MGMKKLIAILIALGGLVAACTSELDSPLDPALGDVERHAYAIYPTGVSACADGSAYPSVANDPNYGELVIIRASYPGQTPIGSKCLRIAANTNFNAFSGAWTWPDGVYLGQHAVAWKSRKGYLSPGPGVPGFPWNAQLVFVSAQGVSSQWGCTPNVDCTWIYRSGTDNTNLITYPTSPGFAAANFWNFDWVE